MYTKVNQNVEKMLEPVNLAMEKVRAIEYTDSIKRELELAKKRIEEIDSLIEKAESELFGKHDKFSATFTGFGTKRCDDKLQLDELGTLGPYTSVQEFTDEYVYLMTTDKEAVKADIRLELNDDTLTITAKDSDLYEEKEEEPEIEYYGSEDLYANY